MLQRFCYDADLSSTICATLFVLSLLIEAALKGSAEVTWSRTSSLQTAWYGATLDWYSKMGIPVKNMRGPC